MLSEIESNCFRCFSRCFFSGCIFPQKVSSAGLCGITHSPSLHKTCVENCVLFFFLFLMKSDPTNVFGKHRWRQKEMVNANVLLFCDWRWVLVKGQKTLKEVYPDHLGETLFIGGGLFPVKSAGSEYRGKRHFSTWIGSREKLGLFNL